METYAITYTYAVSNGNIPDRCKLLIIIFYSFVNYRYLETVLKSLKIVGTISFNKVGRYIF